MNIAPNNSLTGMLLKSKMNDKLKGLQASFDSDQKRIDSLKSVKKEDKLHKVAGEFTAMFMGEIFKSMSDDVDTKQFGFGGSAESMFKDMTTEEYAKQAAQAHDNGLAEIVYQSLVRKSQL